MANFDSAGKKVSFRLTVFDNSGNLIKYTNEEGSHQSQFDQFGYEIEREEFSKDNQLNRKTVSSWDKFGNLLSKREYGADGTPMETDAVQQIEYDYSNNRISYIHLNSIDKIIDRAFLKYDNKNQGSRQVKGE